jgi:gliding motility-associated-like protein
LFIKNNIFTVQIPEKMKRIVFLFIIITITSSVFSQTDTKFWFVAPEVSESHGDNPVLFRITTANLPADVEISMPANTANFPTLSYSIAANSTLTVNLTALGYQDDIEHFYDFLDGIPGKSNKGIYIETTNPVTVYYEVNRSNNCDIFALKGNNALGKEFFAVFQNNGYNMSTSGWVAPAYSALEVVAIEDGTVVTFESTQGQDFYAYGVGTFNVTLDKGETFSIIPEWNTNVPTGSGLPTCNLTKYANDFFGRAGADHLSGVRVTSTKSIAITKKDDSVRYYCVDGWSGGCYDLIGDQMVPLDILGLEYIAMRGGLSTAPENVYIVATEDNTDIFIDGVFETNIDRGETYMYEFWVTGNPFVHIRGDKKLSVLHVSGFGCEVGGAILPPTDKCTGSTQVAITRATSESFFINLMVWTGAEDEFYINGVLQDVDGGDLPNGVFFGPGDFTPLPSSPNWLVWRSGNLGTAYVPVGVSTLVKNTEDVFHLGMINGGAGTGCRFGYFSDFNELKVDAEATGSGSGEIRACSYEQIQLYASGGTTFDWWPANYLSDPTVAEPLADPPAGTSTVFYVEVSGACGLTDTATVTVTKFPHVEAQFSVDRGNGCSPLEIEFHETSTQINERYWNFNFSNIGVLLDRDTILFGDHNNYDTDTTFTHTFINTTNETDPDSIETYEIRLLVKNSNDCVDTAYASVIVYPEVNADFTLTDLNDTIGCSPLLVQYIDNSNNEDFYYWKFGDGVSSTLQNPTHEFKNILNSDTVYNTELIVRSIHFCRDTIDLNITLYPYLEAGFVIDNYEGCSPLDVEINTNTVFEDSVELIFGDGDVLRTSSLGTIVHTYTNTGITVDTNTIELHVFNDEGCEKIWYDTVIVYPEITADYTVDGGTYTGCNSRTITFTNTSNTGTHTASKFLWTFGDGTNSNAVNPVPHLYNNTSPADKNYPFKLNAESIYGCSDDTTHTITIYRAFADFAIDTDEGCSPITVDITNNSEGSALVYDWTFNNGDPNSALSAPPDPTYTNTTAATITPAIQLQVTGNGGCSTTASSTITVHPEISVIIAPLNQSGCDSLVINFTSTIANIALPGVLYDWDFGDATSSTSANPQHIYRNLSSNSEITYPVRLDVETTDGCANFATTDVTVNPYVRAKFAIDKANGCSPHSINVTPTYYIGIAEYRWDFNGDAITDVTTATATPQPYTFPRNQTGADITYNVTLDVLSPLGTCTDSYVIPIKVYSETKADFDPQGSIDCNPYEVNFINNSFNATSYLWNFDDGTTSALVTPTHIFTNLLNSTQVFDVNLAVTSNRGCTHDTTATVSVRRYVEANFDIDISEGCSPLTVNITNNSKGGTYRWYWNSTDGAGVADYTSNTTGVTFDHEYINNSGNVETVYLTCIAQNASGCRDTLTRPIIVQSAMNAQFVSLSGTENCTPFTVNFDNQTDPASDAQYFTWDFDDGTSGVSTKALPDISHIFTNSTDGDITRTVTLTAESAYGCPNSTTRDITIYRRVIADFELNTNEDCSPVEIEITNKSKGGTYEWSWDNPPLVNDLPTTDATPNPILHTYTNTTQADVIRNLTVVASNGHAACNKTLSKVITVHSSVIADFTISDAANCNPLTSTFSPTVSADADKFYWYYSDGTAEISSAASAPVTHVFNNAGTSDKTFQIEMRAETVNGCKNSITKSVQVYSYLDANFAMESSSGCPPFSTTIENTSFGNAANTYDWLVDGTVEFSSTGLLPFTHTYDNTNPTKLDYDILLHAENIHGCVSEYTGTITVAENVQAIFSMTNDGCTPLPVTFTNSSLAPSGTLYYWDFKDGSTSTLQNPGIHTFYNPSRVDDKTFNVELSIISPSYCTDQTSAVVTSYHQPLAQFYLEKSSSCPPLITDMDMNESVGEDEWQWRFGDGNFNITDVNIENYTYQNTLGNAVQNYKLELWVGTNEGCKDSSHLTLSVYPEVIADFTYDAAGCSPFVSQFNNTSENANFYIWNFDDGNASNVKNPTNRFDNIWDIDRTYKVYLKASSEYNCWDTITHPVTAYVQPIAEFDVTPPVQKFPLNRAFIDNLTEPITGPFNYLWEFGNIDESTSTAVEPQYFDYDHWGEKVIKLSVTSQTSNCNDDITKTITILPPDVNAEFVTNINGGCLNDGLEVQFTASQSAYSENYEYEWDFGDGSDPDYSRVTSHVYESAGIYYVKLTATSTEGAGEDYEYKTIRVYSNPVANFEVSPKLSMLNIDLEARVEFFNLSECNDTSGCAYIWNFGDGGTAISRDVTHNYTELGKYDVSLYVTTANGCRDSLILLEEVEIIGAGEIAFPNAFTPNGDGLNDTFRPVSEGVIKYELLVYNRWGELIFTTKDLSAGWNGTVKGELAKPDVYVWKAMGNFTNGRSFELAGDVTLIR